MDKEFVIHSYNKILHNNKKEWPTGAHNNADNLKKQAREKRIHTLGLHSHETLEKTDPICGNRKQFNGLDCRWGLTEKRYKAIFCDYGNALYCECGVDSHVYAYFKTHHFHS